jgi:predicted Ser/Thr protein kinase
LAHRHEHSETLPAEEDSFDELLKRVAHVSGAEASGTAGALYAGRMLLGGRLRVVRRIGEGGMGIVYGAYDAQRAGSVALKTLSRLDAGNVYRLKNEFRSLADLSHPNVCRLHELFAEDGQWFFTMELIDGERFDRWVRPGGVLDEGRLRDALPQLVDAVSAIHDLGKLHRDLKPSNVLVTAEGRVVVLDFGLAVDPELGGVGQTVADEHVSGTPAYMAPEQAAGHAATIASDFYALGAMLFEALTGKLPFEGRVGEMLAAKQTRAAPAASEIFPGTASDLDTLCRRLLAREPTERPDAAALRGLLPQPSSSAPRSSSRSRSEASDVERGSTSPDAAAQLLGREAELSALRDAYEATLAGRAVVLLVSGESGMGKTALCTTFLDALRAQSHAVVLAGRCYERENVPFKAFDSLVDELSRHLRKLSREDAALVLPREVFALARIFPVLDRVEVVAQAPKKNVPDPHDLKRRAIAAFGELLGRVRDRQPLVAFIDDLQWTDQDSVWFMRQLLTHPEPTPALLVCAHRSEGAEHNALLQSVRTAAAANMALDVRTLAVGPLPEGALQALTHRLLQGSSRATDELALVREAHGSPFFAAELARAARLRKPDEPVPSLADALSLHLLSLPPDARRLLAVLALIGQPLAPRLAIEASGVGDGHRLLDLLRSEQLVRMNRDADGERTAECYHDRIRELVAGGLEPLLARELSLALSRVLLVEPDTDPELLARCLESAGLFEQAAEQAARAADKAYAAMAFDHAAGLYARALEHGRFDPERTHALRVGKAEALMRAGRGPLAGEAYLEARQGASEERALELTRLAGEQYLMCGQLERGRELFADWLRAVGVSLPTSTGGAFASVLWSRMRLRVRGLSFEPRAHHDPDTLRKLEALRIATHCFVRSDGLRAADFCARWTLLALRSGHAVEVARALTWGICLASNMQTPEEQVEPLRALSAQLGAETGDLLANIWLPYTHGIYLCMTGKSEAGIASIEKSLAMLVNQPYAAASYDRPWLLCFIALCKQLSGRLTEARADAEGVFDDALARGDHTVAGLLATALVISNLAADRSAEAERIARLAARNWRSTEVTIQDLQLMIMLPMIQMYRGEAVEAWAEIQPQLERLRTSFYARILFRGQLEPWASGCAAAAARATRDAEGRASLLKRARQLGSRAAATMTGGGFLGCTAAVLACAGGDQSTAISVLRTRLSNPALSPLGASLTRRRLGELLDDDEGRALIAEADAFLRKGGVVDPARFVAALYPGIEPP